MKFNIIPLFFALWILGAFGCREVKKGQSSDSTFFQVAERQKNDPAFAANMADFEGKIKAELDRNRQIGEKALPFQVINIPVVVHLMQSSNGAGIPDQLVNQQLEALNRDFRRKNTDEMSKIPEAFRVLAADTRIQFVLARRDPSGASSSGVVRATPGKEKFDFSPLANGPEERNPIKFKASGGDDAWPADQYLNIWVCQLDEKLKEGYASLPADLAGRAVEDGVVVDQDYFGFSGAGRSKGRTLTNLVAKWLGIRDIWGMGDWVGSDEVEDTPIQEGPNNGKADYPLFNRAESPYGDMYCNFMDATDDTQRLMFSAGQADRMYAGLISWRPQLIDSEADLDANAGPAAGIDHYIEDQAGDTGVEPNPLPGPYYYAEGIAVNQNGTAGAAGITLGTGVTTGGGATNYIHVRVRRTGAGAPPPSEVLHVYWANASTGNNDWYDATRWNEIGMGYSVYTGWVSNTRYINPPITLPASLTSGHICLIARLEQEAQSCPDRSCNGSPGHPTMALGTFVRDNNNVAWQNLDIVASEAPGDNRADNAQGLRRPETETQFANFTSEATQTRLVFANMPNETPIFNFGKVAVGGKRLLELWEQSGRQGEGIEQRDSQIVVSKPGAYISLNLPPGEFNNLKLRFLEDANTPNLRDIYLLNLEQQERKDDEKYATRGGVVFALKAEHRELPPPPLVEMGWLKWIGLLLLALLLFWFWRRKGGPKPNIAHNSDSIG